MCCRYLLDRDHLAEVFARLGLQMPDESLFQTRYNIPPGGGIMTVRLRPDRRSAGAAPAAVEPAVQYWGLIPAWARERKGFGAAMANARGETVADKPVFRNAWRRKQRCVIPASGFYDWEKQGRERLPWLFRRADGRPFCFAGLWDSWRDPSDDVTVESCTLITTAPNELLARVHDRMPVMLDPEQARSWLDPDAPDPQALLNPYPADAMSATPVSLRVNTAANDDPSCLEPRAASVPEAAKSAQLGFEF